MARSKKRKKHTALTTFIIILILLLVSCFIIVYAELHKITAPGESETAEASDIKYESRVPSVSGITNIMLIGQDRRPGEERARSDSMILCSMNEKTQKITMISLMRDMYVPIPGHGSNRINAAYSLGGRGLLDQTIEDNFGIHIDGNAEIDFEGFMSLIDKIGGVEIDLNAEEAEYMNVNNTGLVNGVTTEPWDLTPGTNLLNAQQALCYARIRFIGNSDWERTGRQKNIISSMLKKLKSLDPITQASFIHSALSCVTTDLDAPRMLQYAFKIVASGMKLSEESYRLPVEGTYTSETIDEMAVLVPDTAANAGYLKQYIGI